MSLWSARLANFGQVSDGLFPLSMSHLSLFDEGVQVPHSTPQHLPQPRVSSLEGCQDVIGQFAVLSLVHVCSLSVQGGSRLWDELDVGHRTAGRTLRTIGLAPIERLCSLRIAGRFDEARLAEPGTSTHRAPLIRCWEPDTSLLARGWAGEPTQPLSDRTDRSVRT
ncbi:hypothetical protein GCM10023339_40330 [Alloalcanivorax gelatiniphagus]